VDFLDWILMISFGDTYIQHMLCITKSKITSVLDDLTAHKMLLPS
jgi:hypothetical protein